MQKWWPSISRNKLIVTGSDLFGGHPGVWPELPSGEKSNGIMNMHWLFIPNFDEALSKDSSDQILEFGLTPLLIGYAWSQIDDGVWLHEFLSTCGPWEGYKFLTEHLNTSIAFPQLKSILANYGAESRAKGWAQQVADCPTAQARQALQPVSARRVGVPSYLSVLK